MCSSEGGPGIRAGGGNWDQESNWTGFTMNVSDTPHHTGFKEECVCVCVELDRFEVPHAMPLGSCICFHFLLW